MKLKTILSTFALAGTVGLISGCPDEGPLEEAAEETEEAAEEVGEGVEETAEELEE